MLLTIETKINVTEEDVECLIEMAAYGISYWCSEANERKDGYDVYDDEEGKWYYLDYEDILEGIKMYIEDKDRSYNIVEYDDLLGYYIASENIDAEVADRVIQYCCFGQRIYC